MTAHREVKDIQRNAHPAIHPHLRRETLLLRGDCVADHFVNAFAFGIVRIDRRNRVRQQQAHSRVVGSETRIGANNVTQVVDEWADQFGRSAQHIQQRAARKMNAAAGQHVFLTIHGKVITVLAGDQLRGNRCVIAVTGNQRLRSRSLPYADIRFRRTHVFRIDLPDHMRRLFKKNRAGFYVD